MIAESVQATAFLERATDISTLTDRVHVRGPIGRARCR
jgi:hypothetical protein